MGGHPILSTSPSASRTPLLPSPSVSGRVAFVPPRFGPEVVGGSEAVTREIAVGLAARGWDVEVLTTRAINHYTWANELPEGVSLEDGVTVRRFATVPHPSRTGTAGPADHSDRSASRPPTTNGPG